MKMWQGYINQNRFCASLQNKLERKWLSNKFWQDFLNYKYQHKKEYPYKDL